MRHETELLVQVQRSNDSVPQWYPLDIGSGNTLTIDYVSNLLSDVSKITSSRSFTVKLPRTRRNDTAFDLSVVPQHQSQRPYRYLPCRIYVDGIDVTGEAYMYLVSSDAATYNAVIVFGLMQEYKDWIDAGLGLKELQDNGEAIQWDFQAAYTDGPHAGMPDPWDPIWYGNDAASYVAQNGLSKAMYFGIYNPGFALTWPEVLWANVHPFVTVRELWERIVAENSLNFTLPNWVKLDMENLAIVLTKRSGNIPAGTPTSHTTQVADPLLMWSLLTPRIWFRLTDVGYFDSTSQYTRVFSTGLKPIGLNIAIVLDNAAGLIDLVGGDMSKLKLRVREISPNAPQMVTNGYAITPTQISNSQIFYSGRVQLVSSEVAGDFIGYLFIDVQMSNAEWETFRMNYAWDVEASGAVQYLTYENAIDYPNIFLMIPNLPDMKQLDLVKMVCNLYGLFPCQTANGIDFIEIEKLEVNKANAYDWSGYLLEDDPDAPHHTDWHMTDLARRNRVSYKKDDKDQYIDEAWLPVDDDTLDREKDFFTIPLAASDGHTIPQYEIVEEVDDQQNVTRKAEFTECEHRLMRVVEWYDENENTVTRLAFQDLSSSFLIAERYASYQAYVNQPRILTERLRVPLADLRTFDYSVPVFLSKYGRHFAVIDIKWTVTQDTCEAKLLMLAEAASEVRPVPPTPTPTLEKIEAAFNAGGNTIYDNMSVDDLKQYLTVVAFYSDNTQQTLSANDYTLSGSLVAPSSIITVSYEGETATFTVAVSHFSRPLRFTAMEDNSSVQLTSIGTPTELTLEYSLNGGMWQPYTINDIISLDTDEFVEMRQTEGPPITSLSTNNSSYRFVMTGAIAASGNIMSLLDYSCESVTVGSRCFVGLFYNCSSLKYPPDMPATTLSQNCYREMYRNSGIIITPYLPATTLANYCYYTMFYNCKSIIQSQYMPATTLASLCYDTTFGSCINCTSYDFATLNNSGTVFASNTSCTSFTCRAVTPPTIGSNTITGLSATCVIYVPDDSVAAYKAAQYWSDRADYIKGISEKPDQ